MNFNPHPVKPKPEDKREYSTDEIAAMRRVVNAAAKRVQDSETHWESVRDELANALSRCHGPVDNLALPQIVQRASEKLGELMKEHVDLRTEYYATRVALTLMTNEPEEN